MTSALWSGSLQHTWHNEHRERSGNKMLKYPSNSRMSEMANWTALWTLFVNFIPPSLMTNVQSFNQRVFACILSTPPEKFLFRLYDPYTSFPLTCLLSVQIPGVFQLRDLRQQNPIHRNKRFLYPINPVIRSDVWSFMVRTFSDISPIFIKLFPYERSTVSFPYMILMAFHGKARWFSLIFHISEKAT